MPISDRTRNSNFFGIFLDIVLRRFIIAGEGGDVLPMCEEEYSKGGPAAEGKFRYHAVIYAGSFICPAITSC